MREGTRKEGPPSSCVEIFLGQSRVRLELAKKLEVLRSLCVLPGAEDCGVQSDHGPNHSVARDVAKWVRDGA